MTPADPIILTILRAVVSIRNCVTDEIVFDGLGFEWMKVSNPFVDIQTRSY